MEIDMQVPLDSIIWIAIAIIFAVIEGVTVQLVALWFAIGAAVSALAGGIGADFAIQLLIFCVVSGVLLALTRPLVKKRLSTPMQRTNADSNIGKTGVVLEEVNNISATGRVNVNGLDWAARTEDDSFVAVGKKVEVLRIEGVKLIVRAIDD